jgi:gamma-glutamylcyclotransferase (GGCT)/AIG2-like uncharacterized protein YtfP
MAEYLFTYGTLQPGHAPAAVSSAVDRLRPVGQGSVCGTLYDFGYYPGAVLDPSSERRIFGTIFELPDDPEVLRQLDEYEEYYPASPERSQFVRRMHPAVLTTGQRLDCWIYVYNRATGSASIVESGRWDYRN